MRKVLPKNCVLVPDHAEKVFEGVIYDAFQWQQELFDGKKASFEMLRRPDTVQILAVHEGRVVLIQDEQPHRGPKLCLPGGRVDEADDDWETAARRELLEETGMSFKNWKLIDVEQPLTKIEWFIAVYIATDYESQVKPHLDGGERIELASKTFEELKEFVFDANNHEMEDLRRLMHVVDSLDDLLNMPEFEGQEVDRPA